MNLNENKFKYGKRKIQGKHHEKYGCLLLKNDKIEKQIFTDVN